MGFKKKIVLCLILSSIFWNCSNSKDKPKPAAINGVIDLQNWDFEADGPVELNGDWEFHWKKLLTPEEYLSGKIHEKKHFFKVPGYWNEIITTPKDPDLRNLPPDGFATYVLKIKGLKPGKNIDLAIKTGTILSAVSIYFLPAGSNNNQISAINKYEPLVKAGIVGRTKEETIPQELPHLKRIPSYSDSNIIIMHISSFRIIMGGLLNGIELGTESVLRMEKSRHGHLSFFVLGILLIMFIYHMILFFLNWPGLWNMLIRFFLNWIDLRNLYFSLICLLTAIWFIVFENLLQEYLGGPVILKFMVLEYLTIFTYYATFSLFPFFLQGLFSEFSPRKLLFVVPAVSTLSGIILMSNINTYFIIIVFHLFMIIVIIVGLVLLTRLAIRGTQYSRLSLIAYTIFISGVANDVLKQHYIIDTPTIAPYALVIFIIAHSYILSKKYTELAKEANDRRKGILSKGYMRSYLTGVDVDDKKNGLLSLMEDKKIYRDENLSIDAIAVELSLTRHQLSELINVSLKTNFKNFINGYRIDEARKLLLENRDRSIIEIAYDTGFSSNTNFHRTFKKITGITPKEYREKN